MFNSLTIVAPRVPSTQVVHNHEHRAPTDESVKLLREMEQKAEERIIESAAVADNGFHGVVQSLRSFADDRHIRRAIFSLNGRKMMVEFSLHSFEATPAKLAIGLRDAIACEIANASLTGIFELVKH